ncbi:putative transcription factor C2C2-CO-like family [Helianthus annuus]|uniref:Putative CONSTANS-like 5 n=1 Tax=Helianthus annuus TaxID=4232 RepID=A0A251T051_HELAN|nr:zinc finger protein CONSTANS-LIKE 5 [Helianthus annuus]KAF5776568.1 putative transcription factor C2C2-CO-like family [Helianthus annuus]KAJ0488249.1 putative transcription factor C2C2-CO-like family [Helianthus annuus]KAJ0504083.1 putative transcription factor C2C2-CO-like family [Helianthus annuus]
MKCFPTGWNVPAKVCESCKTAVALLFCRKDTVFLCLACDVKLHSHTRHERVWMCEVCEQAPASVTCKADAAALCVTCDRDIHSANPLSRRHDRVPVVPFYDCAEFVKSSVPCTFLEPSTGTGTDDLQSSLTNDDVNWGIPAETINFDVKYPDTSPEEMKSIDLLFPEPDHLLDFDFPVPTDVKGLQNHFNNSVNDSVVPFQLSPPGSKFLPPEIVENRNKCYEIDFTRSNINSYNKNGYVSQSLNHSVSSSSIEAGIVPDGKSVSEISHPFVLQMNDGGEMNGIATTGAQQPTQLSGIDREARVMRYREKRKNRKFEKTIRYASRKAYAETRPRIKGRFAKRTDSAESDVDRWLFTAASGITSKSGYGVEVEYGVVPSYCREV